jgi:hypothetical protein
VFFWNDAQMNGSSVPLRWIVSVMISHIEVYDFHHVVVHDFFIQIEIHFFNYLIELHSICVCVCVCVCVVFGFIVQWPSAQWTRGFCTVLMPFQQARNAEQMLARSIRMIRTHRERSSAHATISYYVFHVF